MMVGLNANHSTSPHRSIMHFFDLRNDGLDSTTRCFLDGGLETYIAFGGWAR